MSEMEGRMLGWDVCRCMVRTICNTYGVRNENFSGVFAVCVVN